MGIKVETVIIKVIVVEKIIPSPWISLANLLTIVIQTDD
jgi:hypothetical protein